MDWHQEKQPRPGGPEANTDKPPPPSSRDKPYPPLQAPASNTHPSACLTYRPP